MSCVRWGGRDSARQELHQSWFQSFTEQLSRPLPAVWWNFSLMRKYLVELQAYGVLNFSLRLELWSVASRKSLKDGVANFSLMGKPPKKRGAGAPAEAQASGWGPCC